MPDKYVGAGLSDLSLLPEEEEGSNQIVVSGQNMVRPIRTQLHCIWNSSCSSEMRVLNIARVIPC